MSTVLLSEGAGASALELFHPRPDVLYDLDATASLAGVTRREILLYCRHGLLDPAFLLPYGAMAFGCDAIRTVRRIESARAAHGLELESLAAALGVFVELERLRAESRGGFDAWP